MEFNGEVEAGLEESLVFQEIHSDVFSLLVFDVRQSAFVFLDFFREVNFPFELPPWLSEIRNEELPPQSVKDDYPTSAVTNDYRKNGKYRNEEKD